MTEGWLRFAYTSQAVNAPFAQEFKQSQGSLTSPLGWAQVAHLPPSLAEWLQRTLGDSFAAASLFPSVAEIIRGMLEQSERSFSFEWLLPMSAADTGHRQPWESAWSLQRARNEALIELLDEWLADESGYDEKVWPRVKRAIEENRLSYRSRFDAQGCP